MVLKVLGSSSVGNCYLLENENECLVIEAGINIKHVKKALDFNVKKVNGLVVSHSHGDHSKHVKDFLMLGIKTYASKETFKNINLKLAHNAVQIRHKVVYKIGNFKIIPFELKHDVHNLGFLINHPECGTIMFATDTYMIPYRFEKVNHYVIEANYSAVILDENIENGKLIEFVRNRIIKSHMNIDATAKFLKNADLSEVRNIVLIHLSGGNSNPDEFKNKIEGITGKNTVIASKGLNININLNLF